MRSCGIWISRNEMSVVFCYVLILGLPFTRTRTHNKVHNNKPLNLCTHILGDFMMNAELDERMNSYCKKSQRRAVKGY